MTSGKIIKSSYKKEKNREIIVMLIAFFSHYFLKYINSKIFEEAIPAEKIAGFLAFISAIILIGSSVVLDRIRKNITSCLGRSYKTDLMGQINALTHLDSPIGWALFRNERRVILMGLFCYASLVGAFVFSFFFKI